PRLPPPTPFPSTTLFRSRADHDRRHQQPDLRAAARVVAVGLGMLLRSRLHSSLLSASGVADGRVTAHAARRLGDAPLREHGVHQDRKSTRLNSSHVKISY